jgi:hypothetical protein
LMELCTMNTGKDNVIHITIAIKNTMRRMRMIPIKEITDCLPF